MTKSDYRRAYETAASELESLLKDQERIESRVLSLRRTMTGLADLLREAGDNMGWRDRIDATLEGMTQHSLTDDIRQVMNATSSPFISGEIRDELEKLGWDIAEQKNPLATINAILNRLIEQGYVSETTKNGRKAWQRKRSVAEQYKMEPPPKLEKD
jgi:hypothetical protein